MTLQAIEQLEEAIAALRAKREGVKKEMDEQVRVVRGGDTVCEARSSGKGSSN